MLASIAAVGEAVRHGGCSGKCESCTMPCTAEKGPATLHHSAHLSAVFHVASGVMGLQHVRRRRAEMFTHINKLMVTIFSLLTTRDQITTILDAA